MKTKINTSPFVVSLNSSKVLEFMRDRELSHKQLDDLVKIDTKLNTGLNLDGDFIQSPNSKDKAIFMANNLATALETNNDSIAAISCTYLATRYPDLKQLKISSVDGRISIELIYDKEFTQQEPIKFVTKKDLM